MSEKTSRREFFGRGARTAALLGLGGLGAGTAGAATKNFSRYRETGSFETGAKAARGIAVGEGGSIYVAADREVLVFDREGVEVRRIAVQGDAICVAERGGEVFVGLEDSIEVHDATCCRTVLKLEKGTSLTSIAITAAGEVFASDSGLRRIWHIDRKLEKIVRIKRDEDAFAVPRDFFPIAAHGENVVAGNMGRHRVETYSKDGVRVAEWGGRTRGLEGFGGCCNPVSLAVIPDGRIVTAEGGLPRVKIFDADGKFLEIVAGPEELEEAARGSHENSAELSEGCQSGGLEVAADAERIFVLDRVSANVVIFAVA